MICQADTPADRATTSSIFRLSWVRVIIAAKRHPNGNAFSTSTPSLIDYTLHGAISLSLVLAHLLLSYLTAVAVLDIVGRDIVPGAKLKRSKDLMKEIEENA